MVGRLAQRNMRTAGQCTGSMNGMPHLRDRVVLQVREEEGKRRGFRSGLELCVRFEDDVCFRGESTGGLACVTYRRGNHPHRVNASPKPMRGAGKIHILCIYSPRGCDNPS